jgi:hypothetical protein
MIFFGVTVLPFTSNSSWNVIRVVRFSGACCSVFFSPPGNFSHPVTSGQQDSMPTDHPTNNVFLHDLLPDAMAVPFPRSAGLDNYPLSFFLIL